MGFDPAADLHAAVAAVAAHRRDNPSGYGSGMKGADAMLAGDKLDEAVEDARQRFHAAGGTAEHADEITERAFSSVEPRGRSTEFHNARAQGY